MADKPYGENMLKITLMFWTDGLPKGSNDKTALMKGYAYLNANKSRGIAPHEVKFDNTGEFLSALQEIISQNGIQLLDISIERPIKFTEL